ncbi:MAG: hypothetical protein COC15_01365 [Legionellales bacterium]|nr:MAG: hypothetical protein COC15_01365 [Legionellales bacterium]
MFNINKISRTTTIVTAATLLLIAALFLQHHYQPRERFYALYANNNAAPIKPLNKPHIDTNTLLSWATLAITASYNMDFVNYQSTLQEIRKYYTAEGYEKFIAALNDNNLLTEITSEKLIMAAVPIGTPVILKEGKYENDSYAWKIQVPILVSFQGPNDNIKKKFSVSLLVTQVATSDAPVGIGISQFNVTNIQL